MKCRTRTYFAAAQNWLGPPSRGVRSEYSKKSLQRANTMPDQNDDFDVAVDLKTMTCRNAHEPPKQRHAQPVNNQPDAVECVATAARRARHAGRRSDPLVGRKRLRETKTCLINNQILARSRTPEQSKSRSRITLPPPRRSPITKRSPLHLLEFAINRLNLPAGRRQRLQHATNCGEPLASRTGKRPSAVWPR